MEFWLQWVLTAAGALAAFGVIWAKGIRPLTDLAINARKILPLLQELSDAFADSPQAFATLSQIASEFRTDSGTSLRDVIDRLEAAAKENAVAAEVLRTNLEAAKRISAQDRAEAEQARKQLEEMDAGMARIVVILTRLEQQSQLTKDTVIRIDQVTSGEEQK